MQTAADADRIIELGAPASRVRVTGSLKYARDAGRSGTGRTPSAEDRGLGGRPLLVAASTHPGEEELALHAARIVRARHPDVMLLVAPRRPERFDEVAALLEREGERFVRRSAPGGPVLRTADTLLLDSVGELLDWMPLAEAVFVGGTVAPGVGGHNVLEPALFGKPVAFGPATGNVEGAAEALLAAGAGRRIHGTEELAHEWGRLLDSAPERARMGEAGRAVVRTQAGVAAATCAGILQVLAERGTGGGCQPQP